MTENQDAIAQLKAQYCPLVDEATLLAIISDYDLSKPSDLESARDVLDGISSCIDVEEATGFDPSGSGSGSGNGCGNVSGSGSAFTGDSIQNEARSDGRSTVGWSNDTDNTSMSMHTSTCDLERLEFESSMSPEEQEAPAGAIADAQTAQLDELDLAGKEAYLVDAFSGLKPFDVRWTLKKNKGDVGKAIEELLNRTFLEENGVQHRGVEAFFETGAAAAKSKKKNRKKRSAVQAESAPEPLASGPQTPVRSKWEIARQDVELLSQLTGMPTKQISSLYHQHGSQLPATINAIIDAHEALDLDINSSSRQQALALSRDYPKIPMSRLITIVQLCEASGASSRDLCEALAFRPSSNNGSLPIQLEFRLPPPDLSGGGFVESKPRSGQDAARAFGNADDGKRYISLRNEAFTKASAAYRRGKSDNMMGGAAAYYSSLGRDYDAKAKSADSSTADAIAARQSTASELDLHGISVVDAVRISREKVTDWWARLGDGTSGHGGYKIVTGKGTHSEGGVPKIRNAVGKMLIREGWKAEIGGGYILVKGVISRSKAL